MMKSISNIEMMELMCGWECGSIIRNTFTYKDTEDEFENYFISDFDNEIISSLKEFFANKDKCKDPSYITMDIPSKLVNSDFKSMLNFCSNIEQSFGVKCVLVTDGMDINFIEVDSLTDSFYHLPLVVCHNCSDKTLLNVMLKFGGYANILAISNRN